MLVSFGLHTKRKWLTFNKTFLDNTKRNKNKNFFKFSVCSPIKIYVLRVNQKMWKNIYVLIRNISTLIIATFLIAKSVYIIKS
jgi:hypothetical protein